MKLILKYKSAVKRCMFVSETSERNMKLNGICGGQSGAGGRFCPSTSVSPANLHSTNCSTITLIYHLGPEVAAVPSGLSPTPLIIIIIIIIII
jgi:hypothetical protein